MPVLSYKYRLYPSPAQTAGMEAMLGAFCELYNACLQQRIEAYRRQGKTLRYLDQSNELKAVRAVDARLTGFSFSAEQQVLRRLDKTFTAFFGRVRGGKDGRGKGGFPRFRARSRFDSADFRVGDGLTLRRTQRLGIVGIPGEIKVKWHRALPAPAKAGAAVVSRSCGKWFVCFQIDVPEVSGPWPDKGAVGIDVGLSSLIATSDGETVPTTAVHQGRRQQAASRSAGAGPCQTGQQAQAQGDAEPCPAQRPNGQPAPGLCAQTLPVPG